MTTATAKITHLQERSRQLRARSRVLDPVLGETYRRRAAELDAHAALLDAVWNPAIATGDLPGSRS